MKQKYTIIGIMSGTSLDGLDVVLAQLEDRELGYRVCNLKHIHRAFSLEQRTWIEQIIQNKDLHQAAILGNLWSQWSSELVVEILLQQGIKAEQVDCIGAHGQTLAHYPETKMVMGSSTGFTIQAANLSSLAQDTGITTVGNFRQRDLCLGGQGAPFVPAAHRLLFGQKQACIAIQNLGGVGNLTLINKGEIPIAFDTGPANMWMDMVLRWHTESQKTYDKDGALAQKGKPDMQLVNQLLMHPYFSQKPPKSTGWEDFGEAYLSQFKKDILALSLEDAASTMAHTTAHALVRAYQKFIFPNHPKPSSIVLCGGGAKNCYFRHILETLFPDQEIMDSQDFGIPVDQVEALSFGILALELLRGRPNNVSVATGASSDSYCGEIAVGALKTPQIL